MNLKLYFLKERLSSSLSSQDKDFGFQNRPRIVANGVAGTKGGQNGVLGAGHTIIVTPVTSPDNKNCNGVVKLQPSPHPPSESGSQAAAGRGALNIKQNIRYAVNYRWQRCRVFRNKFNDVIRSLESSSSSTTATPLASSNNGSWDEVGGVERNIVVVWASVVTLSFILKKLAITLQV